MAPRIGPWAHIGGGANVMWDIDVGTGARVGVNAVVLDDVPPSRRLSARLQHPPRSSRRTLGFRASARLPATFGQ